MNEKLLNFFETIYNQELETKERLLNGIQITAAMTITNVSSLIYMLRTLDYSSPIFAIKGFFIFAALNGALLILAFTFIALTYKSSDYMSVPDLAEINKYLADLNKYNDEITKYNKDYDADEPLTDTDQRFHEYLIDTYSQCSSFNSNANKRRSSFSYKSKLFAIISYLPLFISATFFISEDMDASSPRKPTDINYPLLIDSVNKLSDKITANTKEIQCLNKNQLPLLPLKNQLRQPQEWPKIVILHPNLKKAGKNND
jgi:hypothetical protein